MAEPLLRRTFSRLRGKEKLRRKKSDLKERDLTDNTEGATDTQSQSTQGLGQAKSHDQEEIYRKGRNITVSKKQNWAKYPCNSQEKIITSLGKQKPTSCKEYSHDLDRYSRQCPHLSEKTLGSNKSSVAGTCSVEETPCLKAAYSKSHEDNLIYSQNIDEEWLMCLGKEANVSEGIKLALNDSKCSTDTTPFTLYGTPGVEDGSKTYTTISETGTSSTTTKITSHGAYLQSLDKSSREWVLSSGKSQNSEEVLKLTLNFTDEFNVASDLGKEGEIWYNPIPEDEDITDFENKKGTITSWRRQHVLTLEDEEKRLKASQSISLETDSFKTPLCDLPNNAIERVSSKSQTSASVDNTSLSISRDQPPVLTDASQVTSKMKDTSSQNPISAEKDASCTVNMDNGATGNSYPSESSNISKKEELVNKIKSPGTVRKLSMKMKKLPELRRKLSLRASRTSRHDANGNNCTSANNSHKESGNVISRYHLDTSVSSRERHRYSKLGLSSTSASKGGYLSDGDSPELIVKSDKHGFGGQIGNDNPFLCKNTDSSKVDISTFRTYNFSEQPHCFQHISGLMNVHLHGLEYLKSTKVESKDVFCAIQVDSVIKARTALLTCKTSFLGLNHTFNIELENAQLLKLIVFSWDPCTCRNRVCCHGTVVLPQLLKGLQTHQLVVKLEPRGLLYVKLALVEQWDALPSNREREPRVFGVELCQLVERENSVVKVPLLIQKCVSEIEKRGLKVVGLYRLCGSAAVKKQLRDAFERDSAAVSLSEEFYLDINVITGILKDYLRELPTPLITKTLYEVVLEAMSKRPPRMVPKGQNTDARYSQQTVALLNCLPEIEKATLNILLDHLSLVASFHEYNRMNSQNLAVCFGPVLLNQNQDHSRQGVRSFAHCEEIASAVDFKRHIEVLHYLLQLWPNPKRAMQDIQCGDHCKPKTYLRQKKPLPRKLGLTANEVVSTNYCEHIESQISNRYAGDWSICGQNYLLTSDGNLVEADYDEVAVTDSEDEEDNNFLNFGKSLMDKTEGLFGEEFTMVENTETVDLEAPFITKLNLKDFDALILDLEQELANQLHIYI